MSDSNTSCIMSLYCLLIMFRFARRVKFSTREREEWDFLYGPNSVEAAMLGGRRQLDTLYLSDSQHIELSSRVTQLVRKAKDNGLPVVFTHKDKLSRLVRMQPHQNIVLKCSPLELTPWTPATHFPAGTYVYCDRITDPQNFGALLRSCLFFGVKTVFTGRKNHCPVNATVSKTSAGALDLIDTQLVDNSAAFMAEWKRSGGTVIATSVDESRPHLAAHQMKATLKRDSIDKVLLILGSEGRGVSPHLVSAADFTIAI